MNATVAIVVVILAGSLASESASVEAASLGDIVPVQAPADDIARVVIGSTAYSPRIFTVSVGTTVTWVNRDARQHTVTAPAELRFTRPFGSPPLRPGEAFSYRFAASGTYPYFDAFDSRLRGTIVVR
jgi:plastocyanin